MTTEFDAVIVGAGFSGLHAALAARARPVGRVFEHGGGVGGTWYWNRYPGARCDSESVYYMFSDHFSTEILDEWDWSRALRRPAGDPALPGIRHRQDGPAPGHPVQHAGRRRGLRRGEQPLGRHARGRRRDVGAVPGHRGGCLSATNTPTFPGIDTFAGRELPHRGVAARGRRLHRQAGRGDRHRRHRVQAVPEIAKQAAHVYVFQRTPNYDIPARNRPLRRRLRRTGQGRLPGPVAEGARVRLRAALPVDERSAVDFAPEERQPHLRGGLGQGRLLLRPRRRSATSWSTRSQRHGLRVHPRQDPRDGPATRRPRSCSRPKDHPFFTKRPPLENGYYETFNRDNVDAPSTCGRSPIEEITRDGLRTSEREYELDAIVFATGFDAMTGTLFASTSTAATG